jgi:hypothetical protein
MTSEKGLSVLDAVALYKELTDVESEFRQLKDVLARMETAEITPTTCHPAERCFKHLAPHCTRGEKPSTRAALAR